MPARLSEQRNNSLVVAVRVEGVEQLPFHPFRPDRSWSQNDDKPVATAERFANFVVPLFGSANVRGAVPIANAMLLKHLGQACHK